MTRTSGGAGWGFVGLGFTWVLGCAPGDSDNGGLFGSGPATMSAGTSGAADETGNPSSSGGGSTAGEDTTDTTQTTNATSGAVDSGSDGSGGSSGGASTTGGGDPGVACSGNGDMSLPGSTGPCTANQNCPQTDFVVQVMGAPGPVVDVDVSLDGVAASTDQNRIWLIGPDATQVLLFDQRGTSLTDDFVGTSFDDHAPATVASAPGPFHGCYRPEQPLAAFDGKTADGTWTLRVETCLFETSITQWQLHLDF